MFLKSFQAAARGVLIVLVVIPASLFASAQHQLRFVPFHSSGIYNRGEVAGWNVVTTPGAACLHYDYTVKENNQAIIKTGQLDLTSGSAKIEAQVNEPAMLYVEVEAGCPSAAAADTTSNKQSARPVPEAILGAAIAPTLLKPSVPRPADFDAFWRSKLKLLRRIPIDPQLTPVSSGDPAVDLYTVKLRSVDSHVQGYLARPVKPGKYPALILYQYAGVYALKPAESVKHAAEGWLTFDVDSHDLPPTQATGVPTNYFTIGNHDRNQSYFLDMYLRDTRAVEYIRSRPDWDGKTIVLMGTSMGGQQSLVTAGLNPKHITAVIVDEPSGADTNGNLHGRKAGYPYWPSDDPQVMETSRYFDPVNFASHIKAPTILAVGFIDTTAPPAGLWTVFNQLAGPKEIVPMIDSAHNNKTPDKQGNYIRRSKQALAILLHGGRLNLSGGPSSGLSQ